MKKTAAIFTLFSIIVLIFSCAGPKTGADADISFADKEVESAINDLKKQIKKNPNNMEYRRQLADIYENNGESLEALKVLETAMIADPYDVETKYQYAETASRIGDQLKAYQAYKEVLQSADGQNYLSRIANKFVDAFESEKIVGTSADEAFGRFSRDGNKIIYQSNQNGNWDILEYDLANESTRQLTNTSHHEENPDYSPDGRRIVYTSTVEDHRDVDYNQKLRDIFVMELESQRETNLTTNGSNDWRPSYSQDGKFIVFVSERNDLRKVPFYELFSDIFIMEHDGRFQLRLTETNGHCGGPSIAPGASAESGIIYFDSNKSGNYEIYRMDFKGQDQRQITFSPGSNQVSPAVSPNGDKIVFFSDRDGNYELYMMNSDGSAQQRLTAHPADDLNPTFSPDGSKVLFHSNRSGNFDLYLLDLSKVGSQPGIYEVVGRIDAAIQLLQ
jgi:Tol biopolymer transport system component